MILVIAQSGQAPPPNVAGRVAQEPVLVAEEVYQATVTAVEDGDSVLVKTPTEQITVHLAGADAPEMSQPGGPEAKTFLSELLLGKIVTVRLKSVTERLARIEVGGSDVSATLVRRGMAWHCPRYTDDRELTSAEADARTSKRGLWSAARPTPPWLHRGAGACWQQKKEDRTSKPDRPDFSGAWIAVSPPGEAGRKLTIRQDGVSLTMEHPPGTGVQRVVYKLNGTTSRALATQQGPVDIVAKTRWNGRSLVVDERRWTVHGEEATNVRQILWLDDRGLLNLEVSSPRPIGESDATRLVLQRVTRPAPR